MDRHGLLIEPLCMQTLRFMAGLRKVGRDIHAYFTASPLLPQQLRPLNPPYPPSRHPNQSITQAFLEKTLPGFHQWMKDHHHRVVGVLTFNIDSLEFIALPPELHSRIMQFHGMYVCI